MILTNIYKQMNYYCSSCGSVREPDKDAGVSVLRCTMCKLVHPITQQDSAIPIKMKHKVRLEYLDYVPFIRTFEYADPSVKCDNCGATGDGSQIKYTINIADQIPRVFVCRCGHKFKK